MLKIGLVNQALEEIARRSSGTIQFVRPHAKFFGTGQLSVNDSMYIIRDDNHCQDRIHLNKSGNRLLAGEIDAAMCSFQRRRHDDIEVIN